jgi:alanine-glyoxylate transaminase/serine-glyoxylate transaminase/serine-pyruvate transaminase
VSAPHRAGRHFLQIPGPTNVPDRLLRAIAQPTIDHRGPAFAELTRALLPAVSRIFRTAGPVIIYPSSGTGAWEAALVNVLAPGDRVLAFDTGYFAGLWQDMATRVGLQVELVPGDWRKGVEPALVQQHLSSDRQHAIRAVMVVHNETSTGVTSDVAEVRAAIDAADHPALLLVDTISSLASIDYRHDQWGVDVTVGGSQKGLMLPPGLGFNAVSAKALDVARQGGSPRSYFDWDPILAANRDGFYPYTPATNLLYGLGEAIAMLEEQTLEAVFARHQRHGQATRAAVRAWGLEVLCQDERRHSGVLTAVVMPDGHDADALRERILERFDMSLGTGLGRLKGRVFRIGHLGDFNDLMLAGTLCGVEMGLALSGVPIAGDGVAAALACLETAAASGVSLPAVEA